MRSQHGFTVSIPIPPETPPHIVLASLETPQVLHHNSCVHSFNEIAADPNFIANDAFFGPFDHTVRAFSVREVTHILPGISRKSTWLTVTQNIPNGISYRVITPFTLDMSSKSLFTLWAKWTVRPRPSSPGVPVDSPDSAIGIIDGWELFHEVILETNRLVMRFVAPNTEKVHSQVTQSLVDDVVNDYLNGTINQ